MCLIQELQFLDGAFYFMGLVYYIIILFTSGLLGVLDL